jgi:hypothetical protein
MRRLLLALRMRQDTLLRRASNEPTGLRRQTVHEAAENEDLMLHLRRCIVSAGEPVGDV